MDQETMQFLLTISDKISVVVILLYAWLKAEKRADRLEAKLILNKDIEVLKDKSE